jgi:hypothetical protein
MKEARALRDRIRHESPAYASLTQATSVGVAEMQRDLIDGETVLLEYALGAARSWLWMVTSTAVASFDLPPRGDIERAARELYTSVTARQPRGDESSRARRARVAAADAELVRQSAGLGQALLGPVAAHLGADWRGKRLLVVAPDALHYVPFAALLDPANPGEALAADQDRQPAVRLGARRGPS